MDWWLLVSIFVTIISLGLAICFWVEMKKAKKEVESCKKKIEGYEIRIRVMGEDPRP